MAFEKSRSENTIGDEELARENAPDVSTPEEPRQGIPSITEPAPAPDAREGIRAPETLAVVNPRERMEATTEEALASRLAEARAAYARAWTREDAVPQEEKDRVTREYLCTPHYEIGLNMVS